MSIVTAIRSTRLQALKNREALKLSTLSVLLGDIENKFTGGEIIHDEAVIAIIKKFISNNNETIKQLEEKYATAELDSISKLNKENEVLTEFLPKQLTQDEIRAILVLYINENPTTNIGELMKFMKTQYAGLYDGSQVSNLAKELISK